MAHPGYILCTTPRSGSTMLCQLLAATRSMGNPNSFFRDEDLSDWAKDWGIPGDGLPGSSAPSTDYLHAALREGRGGTAVFGMRLMAETLPGLLEYLCALSPGQVEDRQRLENAFGPLVFIYLHREDSIAQAVSLLRAEQSGLWHRAPDGSDIERLDPTRAPGYDFDLLHAHVSELTAAKAAWRAWFDAQAITPIRVSYDALARDPGAVLDKICTALGVTLPTSHRIEVPTAKLRDATSEAWAARYRSDLEAMPGP